MTQLRQQYRHELADLERELLALGQLVDESLGRALWALRHQALSEARAIIRDDDRIDDAAALLEQHALQLLALQGPVAGDLRMVSSFIHCANELERIGDHAEGIAALVLRSAELPDLSMPPEIDLMAGEARAMLRAALDALVQRDAGANMRLQVRDDLVDSYYQQVFHALMERMRADPSIISHGTYLLWIAHKLERVADRATNIAEYVEFIVSGRITTRRLLKLPEAAPPVPPPPILSAGGEDATPS